MHRISASQILAAWERGEEQHPLDRALTLLALAHPGSTRAELAALPLPVRDRQLWELRVRLFGPRVEGRLECPTCAGELSFDLPAADFPAGSAGGEPVSVRFGDRDYFFRVPTSLDLAAALPAAGEDLGVLQRLAARCLVRTEPAATCDVAPFSASQIEELSATFTHANPQAENRLEFRCPDCGHEWHNALPVADFFWTEVAAAARRLLREVDALARVYHWSEEEILSLSDARRNAYLELAQS